MYLADTLSRHYVGEISDGDQDQDVVQSQSEEEIEQIEGIEEINQLVASDNTISKLREAVANDESLQAVKAVVQRGWLNNKRNLRFCVSPYFAFCDELVWHDGLLRGDRVLVPKSLREEIMRALHSAIKELDQP